MRVPGAFTDGFFVLTTFLAGCVSLPAQTVRTVAGGRPFVVTGIGGPATGVALGYLAGVAVDSQGDVYAADTTNNFVVKVNASGVLTVVAGVAGSKLGSAGDGGPATKATFTSIGPLAVDGAGNLFIQDACSVRKVDTSGNISTFAGGAVCGFGGDGGPATQAALSETGIAADSVGNLYIADTGNGRVRKVTPGGIITTVAGNGGRGTTITDGVQATASVLIGVSGVAVDANGVIYIAGADARIRRVGTDGIITTIGGGNGAGFSGDGGLATAAQIAYPTGLTVDSAGGVDFAEGVNFAANQAQSRVRRIAPDLTINTIAGTGTVGFSGDGGLAISAMIAPLGVAADGAGNLYIADSVNQRVRRIIPSGVISTFAGDGDFAFSGDGGASTAAVLNNPSGVLVDPGMNLYISDTNNNRIRKVSANGIISTIAGASAAGFSGDGGPAVAAELKQPKGLAMDGAGNLYIADVGNARVRKVDTNGLISTVVSTGTTTSSGISILSVTDIALDSGGNLYVLDLRSGIVFWVMPTGQASVVTSGSLFADLNDVAVSATGEVYISPVDYSVLFYQSSMGPLPTYLLSVSSTGQLVPFGSGFYDPGKIAFDAQGNLYVPDSGLNEVVELSPSGAQLRVFLGFKGPTAVAFDQEGNLYVADSGNNRVQEIFLSASSVQRGPIRIGPAIR